jgi:hypothetical protein
MPATCVVSAPEAISAAPKSVIFTSVSPVCRMFAGFMSRCVTPSLCANSSARVHLKMISTMRSTGSKDDGLQYFSSVPPSTYSITR